MSKSKGNKKKSRGHCGLHDKVQFLSNEPYPNLPGFPSGFKTLRGQVINVKVDGTLVVKVRKKTYEVSPKKCLKLG